MYEKEEYALSEKCDIMQYAKGMGIKNRMEEKVGG